MNTTQTITCPASDEGAHCSLPAGHSETHRTLGHYGHIIREWWGE